MDRDDRYDRLRLIGPVCGSTEPDTSVLQRTTHGFADGLGRAGRRLRAEIGVLSLGTDRGPDGDDDRGDPANERHRQRVIIAVAFGDARLDRRVLGRDEIAQLIGKAGERLRASGGDNSFKWTGTMPQAPWTATCMRKPPSARRSGVALNAHKGMTGKRAGWR